MSVLSVLPGTLLLVARMIDAASGVTQVVKLRLNPGVEQERLLAGYCGTARRVWNRLLGRIEAVTAQRKAEASYGIPASDLTPAVGWTKASLDKLVREHKDEWAPWHAEVPAVVLERTAHHLAAALGNWKAARARWPARKRLRAHSGGRVPISFNGKDRVYWLSDGGRRLHLPVTKAFAAKLRAEGRSATLGPIPVVADRRGARACRLLRDGRAQVQEATVSFTGGYWWVSLCLRVLPAAATRPSRRPEAPKVRLFEVLGLDAGMGAVFVTLNRPVPGLTDESGKISAPRYLRRAQHQLAAAQQALARTTDGSRRRRKALARVRRLHGRVAARRDTFHQHLAIALVESAPLHGIETLNLRGMARRTKGFRFGPAVGDNGWHVFTQVLHRQASKRGAVVVAAPRVFPSSKTCSGCGAVTAKLALSERTYSCTTCNTTIDRDVNAAVNLAAYARTQQVSAATSSTNGVSDAGEASSRKTAPTSPAGARRSAAALAPAA